MLIVSVQVFTQLHCLSSSNGCGSFGIKLKRFNSSWPNVCVFRLSVLRHCLFYKVKVGYGLVVNIIEIALNVLTAIKSAVDF